VRCVFAAETGSEDLAIAAFRAGAEHYVKDRSDRASLHAAIEELNTSECERAAEPDMAGGAQLVGHSESMRRLRARIQLIAPVSSNVLILGETGTGKELVAELLHRNGPRSTRPFVCINTAAIPDSLLENELFGHERGAFTGATSNQVGKLAAANGGTLFLDEIGDVSLPVQAKLLRAIENKVLHRLGGTDSIHFDARIVSATNSNLEQAASDGRFRQDLYYRLNVVRVELPPLRDRVDDIPPLVVHYLQRFNKELGRSVRGLSQGAMDTLCAYRWPGNVRELRNVIEALLVNLAPETRGIVDVPPEVMRQLATAMGAPASERERLLNALTATNWNKSRAARQLRCSRMTLYRKMEQHKVARR
jgi:DNA-binding NtrC family response regulator